MYRQPTAKTFVKGKLNEKRNYVKFYRVLPASLLLANILAIRELKHARTSKHLRCLDLSHMQFTKIPVLLYLMLIRFINSWLHSSLSVDTSWVFTQLYSIFFLKNHLFICLTSCSCTVSSVSVVSICLPPYLQGTPSVGLSFQFGCRDGALEGVLKLGYLQYFEDIQ